MTTENEISEQAGDDRLSATDLSRSPIRSQLLWASFFPLALFGLFLALVIFVSFQKITFTLAEQRNLARVQLISENITGQLEGGIILKSIDLQGLLDDENISQQSSLYLFDRNGRILIDSQPNSRISDSELQQVLHDHEISEDIVQIPSTKEQVIAATAEIKGSAYTVLLIEPWTEAIATANGYQLLIVLLIILGIVFSLLMLSWAITRIVQPIIQLTDRATKAVPGSVFRPIVETGPKEIRMLIHSFNLMVIRLARQHTSLRQYAHKALLSQEEERQRLSREMHDGTLQDLVGLHQRLELYQRELENSPEQAVRRLNEIDQLINHTIEDVRNISIALRPTILDDLGLPAAIESMCKQMDQSRSNLSCTFLCAGISQRLSADLELAVYRVVQESLTNIRKHVPNASLVKVELIYGKNELQAKISNNGKSFINQDVQGYIKSGHIGLAGMYERARLFGGSLNISSGEGADTIISLRLPYNAVYDELS